ncbi:DEAD/DEAH box helicase [Lentisphaerota bacterium ZTH]|nr:DEAD/DEAH box helicase [Lentisphaerota bacterium]WET05484.1 DEAD/DEAH box helicase [Lentisphaerota bacterium ZTH]
MVKGFEARLIDASSPESLSAAKLLLKKKLLLCGHRDQDGTFNAVFENKNRYEYVSVATGESNKADCSCGGCGEKLCEHAVAAIMYYGRFRMVKEAPIKEEKAKYAGLKYQNFDDLAKQENFQPEAQVVITTEAAFPHVPSKWENAVLSVKLKNTKKEYVGNLNNIRQLYFNKTLSVSLRLEQFSLQDRQIIRFLAINSEPDSSKLLLNSEQTAELFHCMVGFDNFYREKKRLIIHREPAEPIVLRRFESGKWLLSPGVRIGEALLPVKAAKVITGRAGCWLGTKGEYWWVPATLDVGWLRNFFRSNEQIAGDKGMEKLMSQGAFPVQVVDMNCSEISSHECSIMLDGKIGKVSNLRLKLAFMYDGQVFRADQGRLAVGGENFWSREEAYEKQVQQDLTCFGFSGKDGVMQLKDVEAAGVFLDKMLPAWLHERGNIYLSTSLSGLSSGGNGVPHVKLECAVQKRLKEKFVLSYSLKASGYDLSWQQVVKTLKAGRHYYLAAPNLIVVIPPELRHFMLAAAQTIQKVDDKAGTFELLRCSVHYWKFLGEKVPSAVPPEFHSGKLLDPELLNSDLDADNADYKKRFAGNLRSYQEEGVCWLSRLTDNGFNVILADEMGLGKTVQTLALLAGRKKAGDIPAMIICPASLTENWKRECEKFVPEFKVISLTGNGRSVHWEKANDYDLIICSYAIARRDSELIKGVKFSYLILDEAQHIKNPSTVNALSCKAVKAERRIVLTGTPLENSSEDLWSIFDFLHPGMLGTFNSFKKHYGSACKGRIADDLAAKVMPFIKRRTKANVCKELPPKQEQTLFCDMSADQRKLYNTVLEGGRKQLSKISKGASGKANFEILTTLLRLRQICCDPHLLPDKAGHGISSAKSELMRELVLQNIDSGHKMLFFSQFTSLLQLVKGWMDEQNIPYEYLDGATRNRQQRVDNFNQNDAVPVFLLSLKAGGTGLNLTSADTVIIYDPWWNPAVELQAADRTHRIGQTRAVNSLKLVVKDSIEEKILALQTRKQEIFDNIIENPASYGDKLTLEELRFIFQ